LRARIIGQSRVRVLWLVQRKVICKLRTMTKKLSLLEATIEHTPLPLVKILALLSWLLLVSFYQYHSRTVIIISFISPAEWHLVCF